MLNSNSSMSILFFKFQTWVVAVYFILNDRFESFSVCLPAIQSHSYCPSGCRKIWLLGTFFQIKSIWYLFYIWNKAGNDIFWIQIVSRHSYSSVFLYVLLRGTFFSKTCKMSQRFPGYDTMMKIKYLEIFTVIVRLVPEMYLW